MESEEEKKRKKEKSTGTWWKKVSFVRIRSIWNRIVTMEMGLPNYLQRLHRSSFLNILREFYYLGFVARPFTSISHFCGFHLEESKIAKVFSFFNENNAQSHIAIKHTMRIKLDMQENKTGHVLQPLQQWCFLGRLL